MRPSPAGRTSGVARQTVYETNSWSGQILNGRRPGALKAGWNGPKCPIREQPVNLQEAVSHFTHELHAYLISGAKMGLGMEKAPSPASRNSGGSA